MNPCLAAAAGLAILVGLIHSVFGEILIFNRMRKAGWVPTQGGTLLWEHQVRILWATWHIPTVIAWGMAAVLFWLSLHESQRSALAFIEHAIAASVLASSALVLVGTRARHPGWIGLLGVAVLVWISQAH